MKKLFYSFLLTAALFLSVNVNAQWSTNPAVNTVISDIATSKESPSIISDGLGGAIITWADYRNGSLDIYAQHINAMGIAQWATDGIEITTDALSDQNNPVIASDGSGGAIITWTDLRNGTKDIYAQRINAAGVVQWVVNGIAISVAADDQIYTKIIPDGAGGAVITWNDLRSGNYDIYAQRISAAGVVQWAVNGVAISTDLTEQYGPTIISDGSGGAIITWTDRRPFPNYDIYAQRINSSGMVQWTADGVAVTSAVEDQYSPTIASDGSGGAIITWYDFRSGSGYAIYAQRINPVGIVQWTADGVEISPFGGNSIIVSDGLGGAIITWNAGFGSNIDIYAQRINTAGALLWAAGGVVISAAANIQTSLTIAADGAAGAIITWEDWRSGSNTDIYAQRINGAGAVQWAVNGLAISIAAESQSYPTIISDGSGGAIITWLDWRSTTDPDIYAQNVCSAGAIGSTIPAIPGSINGTTNICSGTNNTYSITPVSGAISYGWSLPNGWSGTSTTNSINTIASSTNGNIRVTASNACGTSAASSLTITVNALPDVTTNLNGLIITANQSGAAYVWLDCNNGNIPIVGETNQSYTAIAAGDYAVVVTMNSCADTSDCVSIISLGISTSDMNEGMVSLYPNPSNGELTVTLNRAKGQSTSEGIYSIINELSQTIQSFKLNSTNNYTIHIENLSSGIYFIVGFNSNQMTKQKIVVTN